MLTLVAVEEDSKWRERKIWRQRKGNLSLCLLFIFASWRWDVHVGACSVSTAHYGMPGSPPSADHQSWSATRRSEGHDVCFCFPVLFLYKRSVLVLRLALVRYSILRGCCVVIRIISCHKVNRKQNVFIATREDNGMFWQWSWVIVALWVWVVKLVFQFLSLVLCINLNTVKKNNLTGRKYLSVFTWLFHQTWIILVHNS